MPESVRANIIADADGWDVRFLGANLPHEGILAAIQEQHADLVVISATIISHAGAIRDLITDIHASGGDTPRILVGGGAFKANEGLWRDVGADGYAPDVRAAIGLARTVVYPTGFG